MPKCIGYYNETWKVKLMEGTEQIKKDSQTIAIIIYNNFNKDGIQFFTPGNFSQQLGYMKHRKGETIQDHMHIIRSREVKYTQETLLIRRGHVRVDFFTDDKCYLTSRELNTGDVILLASGGHGFEFLEETEIIEIKQGPYCGDQDKIRFNGDKH